ncbi:DUF2232 domain-containing protein [uncultured Cohaesibacter sp.]|uniref:DUF2232 domain-containing protein n=1 Tax=uncultured Cohaesibacter sp. TaxID=1002546 RepID=UPI0029C8EA06|nr:DUF2232 domain-containing protein [uncultured Cohaesibacter sp.]
MSNYLIIGIVAGLCTALLNLSGYVGGMFGLGFFLIILSPLPLMIASLGWGSFTGLVAVVSAGVALSLLISPLAGLLFMLVNCVPPWWLSRLVTLSQSNGETGEIVWYPMDRLLMWIAAIACITSVAMFIPFGFSLDQYRDSIAAMMNEVYKVQQLSLPQGAGLTLDDLVTMITWMAPMASVLMIIVSSVVNLYLAAKIVQKSGRLQRPWPDLHQLTLPPVAVYIFLVSLALFLTLGGLPQIFAQILTSAFGTVLLLVGLSVLHYMTRQSPARLVMLWTTYFMLAIFQWIGLVLVVLAGAEIFFNIRSRMPRGPLGPLGKGNGSNET